MSSANQTSPESSSAGVERHDCSSSKQNAVTSDWDLSSEQQALPFDNQLSPSCPQSDNAHKRQESTTSGSQAPVQIEEASPKSTDRTSLSPESRGSSGNAQANSSASVEQTLTGAEHPADELPWPTRILSKEEEEEEDRFWARRTLTSDCVTCLWRNYPRGLIG